MNSRRNAVLLDLDGTLVDSMYLHVLTWGQALREHGLDVPLWRIHTGIGMGSHRLVPWLLGRHVPQIESLTTRHHTLFLEQVDSLRPTPGALDFLDDLERREVPYLIATSAGAQTRAALLHALGREDLPTTDSDEVESSKPAPDLLLEACAKLNTEPTDTTMIGDSPWDVEAARRIGMRCLVVRCGGFDEGRLKAAGADDVVDDPRALIGRL